MVNASCRLRGRGDRGHGEVARHAPQKPTTGLSLSARSLRPASVEISPLVHGLYDRSGVMPIVGDAATRAFVTAGTDEGAKANDATEADSIGDR